jgi:hypothetical protein
VLVSPIFRTFVIGFWLALPLSTSPLQAAPKINLQKLPWVGSAPHAVPVVPHLPTPHIPAPHVPELGVAVPHLNPGATVPALPGPRLPVAPHVPPNELNALSPAFPGHLPEGAASERFKLYERFHADKSDVVPPSAMNNPLNKPSRVEAHREFEVQNSLPPLRLREPQKKNCDRDPKPEGCATQ